MAKIDLKNCTLTIKDGGSNEVEIKVGDGTLVYSEKKNMEYVKDRGNLDTVREGDQEPMDLRFDMVWEFIRSSTSGVVSPMEALKKENGAADWASTSNDACEPYAVDIQVAHDPICATEELEIIIFPDFRYEELSGDLKAGTLSVSGKCNATKPTITRVAQTT